MSHRKDKHANTLHRVLDDVINGAVVDPRYLEPVVALIALNKARHALEVAERRADIAFERAGLN